ncbi:MAG: hypothetical protein WCK70_01400 [Chloroflexales bacterium]
MAGIVSWIMVSLAVTLVIASLSYLRLAVLWQHNLRTRLIALTMWVVISLIGGVG